MSNRRQRLLPLSQEADAPSPRLNLARSHKNTSLPGLCDLMQEIRLQPPSERVCSTGPSELHEMIVRVTTDHRQECQWRAIQLRCQTHPHEASRLDRRGRTCLHAACAKKPTLAVVNAIIEACDGPNVAVERDKHGRTPLAIAISFNASLAVIGRLLEANPEAARIDDHLGHLPLHLACAGYDNGKAKLAQMLLPVHPEAAGHESNNGRTPLHLAIEGRAQLDLIQLLVQACPESVVMDGCGLNPLFMAIYRSASLEVTQALVDADLSVTNSRDRGGGLPLRRAIELQSPTAILQCLCTSPDIVTDVDSHMGNTALHASFQCGVPRESMVRLLVTTAPHVSTLACRSGHTPLTLACEKYIQIVNEERSNLLVTTIWDIASLLLRASKHGIIHSDLEALLNQEDYILHSAVSTILPWEIMSRALAWSNQARVADGFGRYPLFWALTGPCEQSKQKIVRTLVHAYPEAASFCTDDGRSMLSVAARARSISPDIIEALVLEYPAALRRLDPQYKLYPFQVAALEKDTHKGTELHPRIRAKWDQTVDEDLFQLSAIYKLLLAAPELVQAHA